MKKEGGQVERLCIERFRCTNAGCRRIHSALPDCLVPYKHYASEVIEGVIDDVITPDDIESENYPCEATMQRWLRWLTINYQYIEGYLRALHIRYRNALSNLKLDDDILSTSISLLDYVRQSLQDSWLEAILRAIYNSGGRLAAI